MERPDNFTENLEQTQESAEAATPAAPGDLSAIQAQAESLAALIKNAPNGDLVADIVDNALKLLRDQTNRGDIKLINKSFKEIRYALKVFAPYRETRKVSIFGSARTPESDADYSAAHHFGKAMADRGWMVITGAGGGIMAAGHGGAGPEPSFGLAIRLPFEQKTNPFIERDKKLINFKYFFTRKLMFVRSSNAIALFPGGFGTLDEGFEVLTLIQTGKSVPMPIVFVDKPGGGYWKAWLDYITGQLLKRGFINEDDLRLFKVTDSVDDAVAQVTHFYSNYHSIRFSRADLILRLQRRPTEAQVAEINAKFQRLLMPGGAFRVSDALPVERDEPALAHLPRLVFPFNLRDNGGLRILIDHLNTLP